VWEYSAVFFKSKRKDVNTTNNNATVSKVKQTGIEIFPSAHFMIRAIERKIPFTAVATLQSVMPQKKVLETVAVLVNKVIMVAVRKSVDNVEIITGWYASSAQIEAIKNNQQISVKLERGQVMMNVAVA
jgi:hypothetical protein